MPKKFHALMLAAKEGDGQNVMDLLDYAWNQTKDIEEKKSAAYLAWTRNAERNGHPQISLYAARLFWKAGLIDQELSCLDVLSRFDVAPAQHLRGAYYFQAENYDAALKLAKTSRDLGYDIGHSFYYLVLSRMRSAPMSYLYWIASRVFYKRAVFRRLRGEYSDFSTVWFRECFDFEIWRTQNHQSELMSALSIPTGN
ncbi:MAG: hypothetical protein ABJZ56_20095 [Paracoccaceae bacterium]